MVPFREPLVAFLGERDRAMRFEFREAPAIILRFANRKAPEDRTIPVVEAAHSVVHGDWRAAGGRGDFRETVSLR